MGVRIRQEPNAPAAAAKVNPFPALRARDRDGRVVSRLDVPSLTHRCPKEDQ